MVSPVEIELWGTSKKPKVEWPGAMSSFPSPRPLPDFLHCCPWFVEHLRIHLVNPPFGLSWFRLGSGHWLLKRVLSTMTVSHLAQPLPIRLLPSPWPPLLSTLEHCRVSPRPRTGHLSATTVTLSHSGLLPRNSPAGTRRTMYGFATFFCV